jgi:CarD family transcriptional regulator
MQDPASTSPATREAARAALAVQGLAGPLNLGDALVHPAHGIGLFDGVDADEFDGTRLEFLRLLFADRRLTLRVPVAKAQRNGLRRPMADETLRRVLDVLAGAPRGSRAIWARRAVEFGAKINSGDPVAIAEVLRDLGRGAGRPDQPSGERALFEQALDRLAGEVAALERVSRAEAAARILARVQQHRAASWTRSRSDGII